MSIYYIETSDGVFYELDSTTNISYKESGRITNHVVETGQSVSDHYVNNPVEFSISGSISDIKSISGNNQNSKSTEDFINGLRTLKRNKTRFTFHFGNKVGSYSNCLFDSLDISQTTNRGSVGAIDSFSISANIKQIRLAQRAQIFPFRDPLASDDYQAQTKGSGTTEEPSPVEADNFQEAVSTLFEVPVETFTGG